MTLTVQCGQCGKQYSTPEEWAGRRAKCPKCGGPMEIPGPAAKSEPDDIGLELLDEGAPAAAAPPAPGPPSSPFAAVPAPPAASGGLGPALPARRPKKRKASTAPSVGHALATFAGSQKLLTAVAAGMGLVLFFALYVLVTSGPRLGLVGHGILLVAGAVIIVGGLRGTRRRDHSTDKARATQVVGWFIVGVVGIVFTFGAMLIAAKSGVDVPVAARVASWFIAVFGIIVVVSGMILAYYVLVLLFPKANVFRIAGWGYVVLTIVFPILALVASGAVAARTAARQREAEREMEEFKEQPRQMAEQGRSGVPPGVSPPFDVGGRSGSRQEGRSDTSTDRPGGSGRSAGFPGPRFRGPTGPRHGPPGGGLDGRLQQYITRFGADKVVTIKVQNVTSADLGQLVQGVRDASGVQDRSGFHSGSEATIVIAPVDDVEALAAKLDIGRVTNVDVAKRTITVDGEGD